MTAVLDDPAVRSYLDTLDRLLGCTPDRALIVDGVAQHIGDALGDGPTDPARVRAVLDELGDTAVIAAEAAGSGRSDAPDARPFLERRSGAVLTVLLLTVGAVVVPVVGWIVGIALLWSSKGWTIGDKIVGTVGPAALGGILLAASLLAPPEVPVHHLALVIGLVVGSIAVAVHLLRRFRERR